MRDVLARTAVSTAMSHGVRSGRIEVIEGARSRGFGPADADLRATVTVNDPAAWRGPLHGGLGLGEGYIDGLWETDDLVSLIRIAARELRDLDGLRGLATAPRRPSPSRGRCCTGRGSWSPRTPGPAPARTSPPTTTSATSSSPASSTSG